LPNKSPNIIFKLINENKCVDGAKVVICYRLSSSPHL